MKPEIKYTSTFKDRRDLKTWLRWKHRRRSFGQEPTPEENQAFDLGYKQGEELGDKAINPYEYETQPNLWEAWESGYSVGSLGFKDQGRELS